MARSRLGASAPRRSLFLLFAFATLWRPSSASLLGSSRARASQDDARPTPALQMLPPDSARSVVLTSESDVGDPDALLPLVLSHREHHPDASVDALVLLSTAKGSARRDRWRVWAATHGVVVGFFDPAKTSDASNIVVARFFAYRAYVQELLVHRPSVERVSHGASKRRMHRSIAGRGSESRHDRRF